MCTKQLNDYFPSRSVGGWVSQETMSWHQCSSKAHLFPVCWWCHKFCKGLSGNKMGSMDWQRTSNHLKQEVPEACDDIGALHQLSAVHKSLVRKFTSSRGRFLWEARSWKELWKDHAGPSKPCVELQLALMKHIFQEELKIPPAAGCGSLPHLTIVLQCGTCEWPLQVCVI